MYFSCLTLASIAAVIQSATAGIVQRDLHDGVNHPPKSLSDVLLKVYIY